MSPTAVGADTGPHLGGPSTLLGQMPTYDVRVRREMTHRRLAISLLRRFARVLSLHGMDAAILAGTLAGLAHLSSMGEAVAPLTPAVVLIHLLGLNALSAYDPGQARRDIRRLASGVVVSVLILLCLVAFPPNLALTPLFVVQFGAAALLALGLGRYLVDLTVRQAYVHGYGLRRAVVVGGLDEVGTTLRDLRASRNIDQYVLGHLAPADRLDPAALGAVDDLPAVLDRMDVGEVLVAAPLRADEMRAVIACCFERGVELFVVPEVTGRPDCRTELLRVGECSMLRLHPARLEFPSLLIKRGVDVVGASLALLLLSPVIALIALAIRFDSPGPVFFQQKRVGLGGRLFTMWKFRSMATDAEAREMELAHLNIYGNGTFKLRHDPRVTRVGAWLRRTSMDELPQLLNVVWGDMSLVGPRPALVNDIDRYQPHHFVRLSVVPGMTGPWQVGGRNLVTDFEEIVRMERDYITRWSLLLDVKILLRTVRVVATGEGAY